MASNVTCQIKAHSRINVIILSSSGLWSSTGEVIAKPIAVVATGHGLLGLHFTCLYGCIRHLGRFDLPHREHLLMSFSRARCPDTVMRKAYLSHPQNTLGLPRTPLDAPRPREKQPEQDSSTFEDKKVGAQAVIVAAKTSTAKRSFDVKQPSWHRNTISEKPMKRDETHLEDEKAGYDEKTALDSSPTSQVSRKGT